MKHRLNPLLFVLPLLVLGCTSEQSTDVGFTEPQGPRADYYDSVVDSSSVTMRNTLHEIIDDHQRFELTDDNAVDIWDIIEQADRDPDPNAVDRVLDVYRMLPTPGPGAAIPSITASTCGPSPWAFP